MQKTIKLKLESVSGVDLGLTVRPELEKLSEFRHFIEGITEDILFHSPYPSEPFKFLENIPADRITLFEGNLNELDYNKSFCENGIEDGSTIIIGVSHKKITDYNESKPSDYNFKSHLAQILGLESFASGDLIIEEVRELIALSNKLKLLSYSVEEGIKLVSNGEISAAIEKTLKLLRQNGIESHEEELINISSSWFINQKELSKGLIDYDNYRAHSNRIKSRLIKILMELKKKLD